jgi:hypothetical protein
VRHGLAIERAHRLPPQAREEAPAACLDVGVEAQRAGVDGRDAGRAYGCGAGAPARGARGVADDESAAAPPAEAGVRTVAMQAHPAEDVAAGGDEHDDVCRTIVLVAVVALEEPVCGISSRLAISWSLSFGSTAMAAPFDGL